MQYKNLPSALMLANEHFGSALDSITGFEYSQDALEIGLACVSYYYGGGDIPLGRAVFFLAEKYLRDTSIDLNLKDPDIANIEGFLDPKTKHFLIEVLDSMLFNTVLLWVSPEDPVFTYLSKIMRDMSYLNEKYSDIEYKTEYMSAGFALYPTIEFFTFQDPYDVDFYESVVSAVIGAYSFGSIGLVAEDLYNLG